MSSTYTDRYRQLAEQAAYRRRIEAFGLAALLAPYAVAPAAGRAVATAARNRVTAQL